MTMIQNLPPMYKALFEVSFEASPAEREATDSLLKWGFETALLVFGFPFVTCRVKRDKSGFF
jgi:hypothetical protein